MKDKPYLLIIEVRPGCYNAGTFSTLDDAVQQRNEIDYPYCIYDLNSKCYVWHKDGKDPEHLTIADNIIQIMLSRM